nr:hypothetical protein GCM10020092_007330 [Actinoplanes digitatis]
MRDRLGRAAVAYAAYPDPLAPTLVLEAAELDREDVSGALSALLTRAVEPLGDVLTDPRRLAVSALRHGAAAALAPAWILAAGADADGGADVHRSLPSGRTLHDLLLRAALGRDLPAVRELLGTWLDGPAAGVPTDQVVLGPAGELTAFAPAQDPAAALARFAADLIDGGYPHPWPAPQSAAELAVTLAAMTGREIDPPEPPGGRPGTDVRELLVARSRLADELAQARAKQLWYERMLVDREAELKRVQRINLVLGATAPARALLSGARAARRTARRVLRPRG